eukprot:6178556-Pleurochrysis_carterae.AAC.2
MPPRGNKKPPVRSQYFNSVKVRHTGRCGWMTCENTRVHALASALLRQRILTHPLHCSSKCIYITMRSIRMQHLRALIFQTCTQIPK